jgi:hypothetical protein
MRGSRGFWQRNDGFVPSDLKMQLDPWHHSGMARKTGFTNHHQKIEQHPLKPIGAVHSLIKEPEKENGTRLYLRSALIRNGQRH